MGFLRQKSPRRPTAGNISLLKSQEQMTRRLLSKQKATLTNDYSVFGLEKIEGPEGKGLFKATHTHLTDHKKANGLFH